MSGEKKYHTKSIYKLTVQILCDTIILEKGPQYHVSRSTTKTTKSFCWLCEDLNQLAKPYSLFRLLWEAKTQSFFMPRAKTDQTADVQADRSLHWMGI